jgi:hypothetical protein
MNKKCTRCKYDFSKWIKEKLMKDYIELGLCARCCQELYVKHELHINTKRGTEGYGKPYFNQLKEILQR